MEATLLTIGLLCLVAAIVGGGLKILGNELPVLQSVKRQLVLGMVGIILVSIALRNEFQTPANSKEAKANNQPERDLKESPVKSSLAATDDLNNAQIAPDIQTPDGGTFRNRTQEVQYRMIALGYEVGYPDGFEGPGTTAAIEAFQDEFRLPRSGTADQATLDLLRARSRKAFLLFQNGEGGEPTDYQKRWLPALISDE